MYYRFKTSLISIFMLSYAGPVAADLSAKQFIELGVLAYQVLGPKSSDPGITINIANSHKLNTLHNKVDSIQDGLNKLILDEEKRKIISYDAANHAFEKSYVDHVKSNINSYISSQIIYTNTTNNRVEKFSKDDVIHYQKWYLSKVQEIRPELEKWTNVLNEATIYNAQYVAIGYYMVLVIMQELGEPDDIIRGYARQVSNKLYALYSEEGSVTLTGKEKLHLQNIASIYKDIASSMNVNEPDKGLQGRHYFRCHRVSLVNDGALGEFLRKSPNPGGGRKPVAMFYVDVVTNPSIISGYDLIKDVAIPYVRQWRDPTPPGCTPKPGSKLTLQQVLDTNAVLLKKMQIKINSYHLHIKHLNIIRNIRQTVLSASNMFARIADGDDDVLVSNLATTSIIQATLNRNKRLFSEIVQDNEIAINTNKAMAYVLRTEIIREEIYRSLNRLDDNIKYTLYRAAKAAKTKRFLMLIKLAAETYPVLKELGAIERISPGKEKKGHLKNGQQMDAVDTNSDQLSRNNIGRHPQSLRIGNDDIQVGPVMSKEEVRQKEEKELISKLSDYAVLSKFNEVNKELYRMRTRDGLDTPELREEYHNKLRFGFLLLNKLGYEERIKGHNKKLALEEGEDIEWAVGLGEELTKALDSGKWGGVYWTIGQKLLEPSDTASDSEMILHGLKALAPSFSEAWNSFLDLTIPGWSAVPSTVETLDLNIQPVPDGPIIRAPGPA